MKEYSENKEINREQSPIGPLRFTPVYKSVIWGGERISAYKKTGLSQNAVGESWEISAIPGHETVVADGHLAGMTLGQLAATYRQRLLGSRLTSRGVTEFPLLIKFIDARHDLSLQVHPGEEIARSRHGCSGKTEMWYIIDSAPGSTIISGFSTPITRDQYRQQVAEGKILDSVAIHPTHPGDVFFIPSGRVHAIGAGNFLLEVQQSSDITYRIYDYDRRDKDGNPRQLHTELAVESIDYRVHDNYKITPQRVKPGMDILVQCPVFDVRLLTVTGKAEVELPGESFLTMTCVKGQVTITADGVASTLSCGHTLLIPAETSALSIDGNGLVVTANC